MEYKLSVKYKEIKDEKTLNSVKESKIYIENADKFIDIKLEEDKAEYPDDPVEQAYVDIGNVFKEIKIDKKSSDIFNLKEIIKKWEMIC